MSYDYRNELRDIQNYYLQDPLQKRFSALICGPIGVGKSFLGRTCRMPLHVDSFDPGGTKGLREGISKKLIVADTRWEMEDPFNPGVFDQWMKAIDRRLMIGYFNYFGTYMLDSASTWGDAIMNYQLKGDGRAGEAPKRNHDYVPQKIHMINYIKKLMTLPCDFILTGHLREEEELLRVDSKTGIETKKITYRFHTTGQAVLTIPLMFDEIYVMKTRETSAGLERILVTEAQGQYIARSRLKANGKLDVEEPASIKGILRKIGMTWEDKPALDFGDEVLTKEGK